MTQNDIQATLRYLKLTDSSRHFPSSIIKFLIEDHQTANEIYVNNT